MMLSEQTDTYEVLTDGRTVWVNSDVKILGRFCKYSAELVVYNSETGRDEVTTVSSAEGRTTAAEWAWFGDAIKRHHGIVVDETYRPEYIT